MAKTVKGARFVLKRTDIPNSTPTVPPNNDHTTGWIDTDIYQGELFLNIYDDKIWFRDVNDDMVQLVELSSGGTIDPSYLPGNYIGAMVYQGTWDASTSNPPSTSPSKGDYWIVSVAGNTDLNGITDWKVGDFAIYNGSTWDKIDNTEPDIYASDVIYSHPTYTSLTNTEEALDYLLDNYVDYDGSSNINISAGTGNQQIISLVNSPNVSGTISSNALSVTTTSSIGTTLTVGTGIGLTTGNLTLSNGNISVNSGTITASGRITGSELQTTDTLFFDTISNRLETDGLGIRFYQGGVLRLEFNNSGIATSYSKLRYDSSKTLDNNLDMVNKEYLDTYVGTHNVGLWSSGGTSLNDPYKIIAWDGINTYSVGVGIQNPTYNLHVNGTSYLGAATTTSLNATDVYATNVITTGNISTNTLIISSTIPATVIKWNSKSVLRKTTTNGGVSLGCVDSLILGSGNAASTLESNIPSLSAENTEIGADSSINFYSNLNSGYGSAKTMSFNTLGNLKVSNEIIAGNKITINNTGTDKYISLDISTTPANLYAWDISSSIEQDFKFGSGTINNGLFYQGNTNRIGINNDSPGFTLDVNGSTRVSDNFYANSDAILNRVYSSYGTFTTSGTYTIINNAVPGEVYLVVANTEITSAGFPFIYAYVRIYNQTSGSGDVDFSVTTLDFSEISLNATNITNIDIDITLTFTTNSITVRWSVLRLL